MAQVNKIDSNITGLAYAEEASLGVLETPTWKRLEPNSYNDFGGEVTTVAPNPINPSRQRKKGTVTDLDASGGFNHNLTFYNLQDLLQGIFFADLRAKGTEAVTAAAEGEDTDPDTYAVADTDGFLEGSLIKGFNFTNSANNGLNVVTDVTTDTSIGVAQGQLVAEGSPPSTARIQVVGFRSASGDIDVDASGDLPKLTSTTLDFTTLGLVVGQWIFVGGDLTANKFATAGNNGFKRIRAIATNALTLDKSAIAMSTEANTSLLIDIYFGDVLRNESGTSIKRRSYTVERTLGAPDDANSVQIQSEYLKGAIPNEFTINIPTANLVNCDLTFLAIDHQQRLGSDGPLQSSVVSPQRAEVYNTSSDFSRIKMAIVDDANEAPTALFAFITEAALTINNNLSANKAVGTLGAFDVTAGTFQVSGSVTAYFGNVTAVQAVRNNSDVTLDMAIVKDNQGMVIDIPLISLGDGRLNVEQDQPITLPLNMDAATAEDVATGMDHTVLLTFFGYLPDAAE
jgi:hypothetical protein